MKLIVILIVLLNKYSEGIMEQPIILDGITSNELMYSDFDEHTLVTDNDMFPYVVAILKLSRYISAGALIDEKWVLTAADALFVIRESARTLRVRLGSINYRKGGIVLPVKYFEIHPNFDDNKPLNDLALIRLSKSVRFTSTLKPIRLQKYMKEADATHFIVTSWPYPMIANIEDMKSMEIIKRKRILSVTHLHPFDGPDCAEELLSNGISDTGDMMCLDTGVMMDPCMRDVGAPVVLNDVLWGIVSSWRPNNCNTNLAGPTFVSLVSPPNVSVWIRSRLDGRRWS